MRVRDRVVVKRTLIAGVAAAGALIVALHGSAAGQAPAPTEPADPATCNGLLADADKVGGVLAAVPRYGSTWVLVVPNRLADKVPNATAPGIADLEVGVQTGTAAVDIAKAIGVRRTKEYAISRSNVVAPLNDIKEGKLDAAILWAPAAGLGVLELGLDGEVALFTVDKPRSAPAALRATAVDQPCAMAIRDELDVNGVLPAELLVSVEIRDLLAEPPPRFDLDQARAGGELFNQICARCHGTDAIADPHGLAPVDLRLSITRFSYPGFHYIVLNGRPLKSMPPFRGTVTDEQITNIYRYLQARSRRQLPSTTVPSTTNTNGGSNQ